MRIDHYHILKSYLWTKYNRLKFLSRDGLTRWQDRRVTAFLKKILPKSEFYRDYFKDYDLKNWRQFPTINKTLFMENFNELNTVSIDRKKAADIAIRSEMSRDFSPQINGITVGLSSGTSGNQSIWLASNTERLNWAGNIIGKQHPGSIISKQKVAFFMRANSNLYKSIGASRIQFEFFDLLDPIGGLIKRLNAYKPTILTAPPSMMAYLVNAQKRGNLNISPIKIISYADVLEPDIKSDISSCFNVQVDELYQATEGFIASTCIHGRLHLNEDLLAIEKKHINRESRRFSPVITDFNRFSQPVIKYELDDILIESDEHCSCGSNFTVIEKIEGRMDDVLHFKSHLNGNLVPIFPDYFRTAIISYSNAVRDYMVVQKSPDYLEIFFDFNSEIIDPKDIFSNLFKKTGCKVPKMTVYKFVPENDPVKKRRRIRREFSLDDNDRINCRIKIKQVS